MNEFLNYLGELFSKAYVYVPTIAAVISAIGFPTAFKIAKILASAKVYLSQAAKITKKTNETIEIANKTIDSILQYIEGEIAYNEQMANVEVNKRKKSAYLARVASLKAEKDNLLGNKLDKMEEVAEPSKKVKVKVKVKKGGE